jgi:hypothetical protein
MIIYGDAMAVPLRSPFGIPRHCRQTQGAANQADLVRRPQPAAVIAVPDLELRDRRPFQLAAAAPVGRRACTPDPALSHWHACQPAAVNAAHFTRCRQPPEDRLPSATHWPASHPVTPSERPGMTHRDEQDMRRRIKSTYIADYARSMVAAATRVEARRSVGYGLGPGCPVSRRSWCTRVSDFTAAIWSARLRLPVARHQPGSHRAGELWCGAGSGEGERDTPGQ